MTIEPLVVVYVSNAESGDIVAFGVDPFSGDLSPLQRLVLGGAVMPLACSPDRRFLYAARRTDPLEVLSFAIDATSGKLSLVGTAPLPANMAYIATDRSGRFLFSASYAEHRLAVSPIDANGTVLAAQQVILTGPNAHAVRADLSNRFVFATNLGGGVVMQQRFDASTGRLIANVPATLSMRAGAGPRHFVFHPDGHRVYLLNEFDASLDVLLLDETRGTLSIEQSVSTLPSKFEGAPWAADVQITPSGRFLYSSERRSSTLAAFAVDPRTGHVTLIGHVPTQEQPRSFSIDPRGRFLFVAGQRSDQLGVYTIVAMSGALTHLNDYRVGNSPTWVEAVQLPRDSSQLSGTAVAD